MRDPELPLGCVVMSSGFSCSSKARPTTDSYFLALTPKGKAGRILLGERPVHRLKPRKRSKGSGVATLRV